MICDRRGFVGTILHLYNALRQTGLQEEESPIFEDMAGVLRDRLFQGQAPTSESATHYTFYHRLRQHHLSREMQKLSVLAVNLCLGCIMKNKPHE